MVLSARSQMLVQQPGRLAFPMMENRLALAPAPVEFRRWNIDCLDLPRSSGDLRLRFDPRMSASR